MQQIQDGNTFEGYLSTEQALLHNQLLDISGTHVKPLKAVTPKGSSMQYI